MIAQFKWKESSFFAFLSFFFLRKKKKKKNLTVTFLNQKRPVLSNGKNKSNNNMKGVVEIWGIITQGGSKVVGKVVVEVGYERK